MALISLAAMAPDTSVCAGETLYNGIELPDVWPPKRKALTRAPMPVPYLKERPKVVPIDIGRQLFVDDFLIEKTTLKRTFHSAEYHPANPVLKPDKPWETNGKSTSAHPFSGGVWYDPSDRLFKMWYSSCATGCITYWYGYATSKDGIHWEKPVLKDVKGRRETLEDTNVCLDTGKVQHDSSVIWLDHDAKDPSERFKYFASERDPKKKWLYRYRTSADGIHWTETLVERPLWGDRTTAFYNPFRRVWCISQRIGAGAVGRSRVYLEDPDPKKLIEKMPYNVRLAAHGESVFWTNADDLDPRNPDPKFAKIPPQLYNLDAAPYESLMLGFYSVWTGPDNTTVRRTGSQKRCDILIAFSRDGFHWDRANRNWFIPASWKRGTWNFGNIQSAGGGCLVVGDKLYFYVSGRAVDPTGGHGNCTTGLATLRRDGFASMDAGEEAGTLTTLPVIFKGNRLFVNVDCPKGELKAEVLDEAGKTIEPFTLQACKAVSCDKTLTEITWKEGDLSSLAGKPVRFRFTLSNGKLYAFWVTPSKSGASNGYVAAGGPGLAGSRDADAR